MPVYAVRPAVPGDARELALVHLRSWQTAYRGIVADSFLERLPRELPQREQRWRALLGNPGTEHVHVGTTEEGQIVGFVRGGRARPPHFGADGELGAIYLLAEHRRNGLGRSLVAAHVRALRAAGYRSMVVWVLSRNPARGFYERLGGERCGTAEETVGGETHGETAYVWRDLALLARELEPESRKPFY